MTDDIVTRLRNSCDHLCIGCTEENAHDVGLEAASRIERLRKESYVWEMAARQLAKELGKEEYADAAYQDEYDILEEIEDWKHDGRTEG